MNTEAEWFKEQMLKCAQEHKRVRKTWTLMIWIGWILVSINILVALAFGAAKLWASMSIQIAFGVFLAFRVKHSHSNRKELCHDWLKQRDLYQQEYEKRK